LFSYLLLITDSNVSSFSHHRLVKDLQHLAAHIEGSELTQEIQSAHPLLVVQSSLLFKCTPNYLYSSTTPASSLMMSTGLLLTLVLLKSTTISLVLSTFKSKWFWLHQSTKLSTNCLYSNCLYSDSCPSLIHPTTAESSENFCRWHDSEWYWKSEVYWVNRNGDRTVPYGAPVLLNTTSDKQLPRQTNCGLSDRQSATQETVDELTPIPRSFSQKIFAWMVLKALEKSKDKILTVPPPPSRWEWVRCSR